MKRRSGFGWMELIIGIALAVLGIFTFVYPDNAVTTLVVIYGIIAVITGIADVVLYVRVEKHIGFPITIAHLGYTQRHGGRHAARLSQRGQMGNLAAVPDMVHRALHLKALAPEHNKVHCGQLCLLVHDDSQYYRAGARRCDDIQPEHFDCGGRLYRRRISRAVRH